MTPTLTVVDVGHGNASVVTGDGEVVVVDAGPGSALLEYLRTEGIRRIKVLIVSHSDADHMRGVLALLASGTVTCGEVRLNADADQRSMAWRDLSYELDAMVRAARREGREFAFRVGITSGFEVGVGPDVVLRALAPRERLAALGAGSTDADGREVRTNSISAVMAVEVGGRRAAILCGDLDEVGYAHLADDEATELRSPVVVYPHHGGHSNHRGNTADTEAFAETLAAAIEPDVVVFSTGRATSGNLRPETVRGLLRSRPTCRVLCTQLSSICAANLPQQEPAHLVPTFAHGRRSRSCCAGSIRIALADTQVAPTPPGHEGFIDTAAPTAMCRMHRAT